MTSYGHKYLYGKYENFKPLLEEGAALRFTDINCYVKRENQKTADNESRKLVPFDVVKVEIDSHEFLVDRTAGPVRMSFPTRRCHTLCFSNNGNSPELFKWFDADICMEIDVDLLVSFLKEALVPLVRAEVLAQDVIYFEVVDSHPVTDSQKLVFYKDEFFKVEDEFRIAIFYPFDEGTVLSDPRGTLRLFHPDEDYITIGFNDNDTNAIVETATLSDGTVVFPKSRNVSPSTTTQIPFEDMDPDEQAEAVYEALWPRGAFPWAVAIKAIADDLRERGLANFKRFRKDGPLGDAIHKAMNLAAKYGYLDRPRRGNIRAIQPDPKLYTPEDWQNIATQALRDVEVENEDHAVHLCAEWARRNCGLEFKRLRKGGVIWEGIRAGTKPHGEHL